MDQNNAQLIINKCESQAVYDYLARTNQVGVNELYLIESNTDLVRSVNYDNNSKSLKYTNDAGVETVVVQTSLLKADMGLASVATSGSYNDLTNQPSINGVSMSGSKTTADLKISYNDLTDHPTIPTVTNSYSSTDTASAISGKGVSTALTAYAQKSVTITGTGALSGGGSLESSRTITHNAAPTTLSPAAVKIAADSYGHVQAGDRITARDVGAVPGTVYVTNTLSGMDGWYGMCVARNPESWTVSWNANKMPQYGTPVRIVAVNEGEESAVITIPIDGYEKICFNGVFMNESKTIGVSAGTYVEFELVRVNISGSEDWLFVRILDIMVPITVTGQIESFKDSDNVVEL